MKFIIFIYSISSFSLIMYRNIIDFWMFILYPVTLKSHYLFCRFHKLFSNKQLCLQIKTMLLLHFYINDQFLCKLKLSYFLLPNINALYFFFFVELISISSTMFDKSGERRHSHFATAFRGNTFSLSVVWCYL